MVVRVVVWYFYQKKAEAKSEDVFLIISNRTISCNYWLILRKELRRQTRYSLVSY